MKPIDKIKKLLRLARSSNQHEAALAMKRAVELAAAHQVEIDGLDPDDDASRITHREDETLSRMPYDRTFASFICRRFFRVEPIQCDVIRMVRGWPKKGYQMRWVGTESDVEIARYVYQFIYRHFAFCWRKHRGRCRNRYSFVKGMYQGLYTKLLEAEPSAPLRKVKGTEIQTSFDAYIAQHFGKVTTSSMKDASANAAMMRGFFQGRKTNINPAVKPAKPAPLALS